MAIPFQQSAPELAALMLNGIMAGMAITFFAWLLVSLSGRQNSSTRFAVWFVTLIGIIAIPFLGWLNVREAAALDPARTSPLTLPESWAARLFLVWMVCAGISLFRIVIGLVKLRRLRAATVPVELAALAPPLRATMEDFPSGRKVTLCSSSQQPVPAAVGFIKPLIILPTWAFQELSVEELNSILIHELAHLGRWDDWTNLLQKVLRALFFFHPAVWWVEKQLSLEREMACDDVVLSRTENPRAYAECLVSMAQKSFLRRTLALTQAAVSRMRQTSRRVAQILDSRRPGATRIWKPALGLVTTFAVFCGISQTRLPELVAFRDGRPVAAAVSPVSTPQSGTIFRAAARIPVALPLKKSATPKATVADKSAKMNAEPTSVSASFRQNPADLSGTNVNLQQQIPVGSTAMLVVFHSQDNSGLVQWTLWVWRVRVQRPDVVPPKRT